MLVQIRLLSQVILSICTVAGALVAGNAFGAEVGKLTAHAKETPRTVVSMQGEKFLINGVPTYQGQTWNGHPVEGLLMNSRMVQGIFDDLNPETSDRWAYEDTQEWDADRNTDEFVEAMDKASIRNGDL